MYEYDAIELTGDNYRRALASKTMLSPEENLIEFHPSERGGGISAQKDFFEALPIYREEKTSFTTKNTSPITGYEIYIDDSSINFGFYTPDKETDEHIKKQIVTHFSGSNIDVLNDTFIDFSEGHYATAIRFKLAKHYFEPLQNNNKTTSTMSSNPYKTIFGELQLKEGMTAMIQFLFKPVEDDWTTVLNHTVKDQAEQLVQRNQTVKDEFSLSGTHDRLDSSIQKAANNVKNQSGQDTAYYMDVRLTIIGPDKKEVINETENVCSLYERLFESTGGQKLIPHGTNNPQVQQDTLENMILRKSEFMRQPTTIKSWLEEYRTRYYDTLIMNVNDLVSLAPIPYSSAFKEFNRINWSTSLVDGELPLISEEWVPAQDTERTEQVQRILGEIKSDVDAPDTDKEESIPSAEELEEIPDDILENEPEVSTPDESTTSDIDSDSNSKSNSN